MTFGACTGQNPSWGVEIDPTPRKLRFTLSEILAIFRVKLVVFDPCKLGYAYFDLSGGFEAK